MTPPIPASIPKNSPESPRRPLLRPGKAWGRVFATMLALTLLATFSAVATEQPAAAATSCLAGLGTSRDPFLVASATDLAKVGSGVNGCDADKHYLQTAHITLDPPAPGSSNHAPIPPFNGSYDGGGFQISGVTIVSGASQVGFFSVTFQAFIRRVHLVEAHVTATGFGEHGGLIGLASETVVIDSSFSGTVTSAGSYAGGLIGSGPFSSVRDSFSHGTVTGTQYVGGLVGSLENGGIEASFSTADVNFTGATNGSAGGLAGWLFSTAQRYLFVLGTATATSPLGASVVTGDRFDFGFVLDTLQTATSVSTGGSGNAFNNPATVDDFWFHAAPENEGTWEPDAINWSLKNLAGNAFGDNLTLQMEASVGAPNLDGLPFLDLVIGLDWDKADVDMVSVDVGDALADFLGTTTPPLDKASAYVEIRNQNLDSPEFTTTLFALNGFVADVYARGDVTLLGDMSAAGGLIGDASGARLARAYATGNVVDNGNSNLVGGLVVVDTFAAVTDAFWDMNTTNQATSDGGTGKTTSALKNAGTFTDTATVGLASAWPLVTGLAPYVFGSTVWGICPEVNDGYPFLLWQDAAALCGRAVSEPFRPAPAIDPGSGTPPVLKPAETLVLIDGLRADVKIIAGTPIQPVGGISVLGDDFAFNLSPMESEQPSNRDLDPFMLPTGGKVSVESSGFQPGAPVFVWLFSTPHLLGEFVVDATGNFSASINELPTNVSTCPHTVQVSSRLANGSSVAINLGVWVIADAFPFVDMNVAQTHGPAAGCLQSLGVTNGFNDASFRSHEALRRDQAASMLTRLLQLAPKDARFVDVGGTHARNVGALADAGIVTGYADGRFFPDRPLTRGEAASLIVRAAGISTDDSAGASFADVASGRTHTAAIDALTQAGIVTGFSDGTFRADMPVTRGQFAAMLVRARTVLANSL